MTEDQRALFTVIVDALIALQSSINTIERRLLALGQPNDNLALPVDGGNVLDRSITRQKIDYLDVGTADIGDATITTAKIADLAVTQAKIASLAVGTAQIEDLAVTNAKLDDLAVTDAKIANATITSAKIASLTADLLVAGTLNALLVNIINLNASNINAGTLSADRIAAGALDITKLTLRQFISGVIFSNNSPVAGSVSWTSLNAVYLEGVAYPISAGSTANKYIWFEPSVSTSTLQSANTFTAATGRFPVAVNNAGVATEVWRQLAAEMITASMLAAASVTGGPTGAIAAETITGDNIAAATITGDKIQAKTILANRLVVGNFENLCEDPNFEQQSEESWDDVFGSWAYSNDGGARNGTWALRKNTTATDDEAFNILFAPCRPGDTFYAEAFLRGTGNGTGKVRISFYNSAKSARVFTDSATVPATSSYSPASVSATCPAGYVWVRISLVVNGHSFGFWYADDCLLKQKQVAAYIESINASSITAGTIDAARIAASTIDATKLNLREVIVTGMTLTNDSPSAGFIAWSGSPITVYYNGASFSISNGSTNHPLVYWDAGDSTFSGAASFTPQPGRFLIATNTEGVAMEAWNNIAARNAIQEANVLGGLIRGIQPELAHQRNNVNGAPLTYTLVNYTGGSGGLFTIGFVVVDSIASPPLGGWLQVLLGIKIDDEAEQQYAIIDAAYPIGGINSWDARLICIASDKKTPGYNVGDYVTLHLGLGFSKSLRVRVYCNIGVSGGSARMDMSVLWGKQTI